jgi:rhodanese-related sulfurtransferase
VLEDSLCPARGAPVVAIARADEFARYPLFLLLNQYKNASNPEAHYRTTGPEILHQTAGDVTHFVAGLGTCGTISGTGGFLKEQDSDVQVLGVYPAPGHDIPGVRSLAQLSQTEFFAPDDYDGLVEVENQHAFEMCLRLNQEESLTGGPSSGMALVGALRLVPDEPGNVVVVIFPDSVFKYASSILRNIAGMGTPVAKGTKREQLLGGMIENARANPNLVIDVESAHELWQDRKPLVIDVREPDAHGLRHIPGALNVPLDDLADLVPFLPEDLDAPLLSVCERGNLSLSGVLFLNSLGYRHARSITGGTQAWSEQGFTTDST